MKISGLQSYGITGINPSTGKFRNRFDILHKFVFHFLFWIFYLLFISFLISLTGRFVFSTYLMNSLFNLPVYIIFTYTAIALINRKSGKRKNFYVLIFLTLAISFLCSFIIILINHFLFYSFYLPAELEPKPWFIWEHLFQNLILLWTPYLFFAVLFYFNNWQREVVDKKELEKKQLETELQLLKSQLNPHFLLNTLNNLYSLAVLKSDKIAGSIQHLSDLFSIVLYECNREKYELSREIGLIKSYIELEQLRYDSELICTFETTGKVEEWEISPMLLFNFVENCFKHGGRSESGKIEIQIHLDCSAGQLNFHTRNTLSSDYAGIRKPGKGIGLGNTLKRLELQYKGHYRLISDQQDNYYRVNLKIQK